MKERVRPMGYNAARRVSAAIELAQHGKDALTEALRHIDRDPDEAARLVKDARYNLSEIKSLLLEARNE